MKRKINPKTNPAPAPTAAANACLSHPPGGVASRSTKKNTMAITIRKTQNEYAILQPHPLGLSDVMANLYNGK